MVATVAMLVSVLQSILGQATAYLLHKLVRLL
jgi:hypothetical protein